MINVENISYGSTHIGYSSGYCEFVDYDCIKYITKKIRELFPNVLALSYGKEKENYCFKQYKKTYDGYFFAELYRYGNNNNYNKETKKIIPGNNVPFMYKFESENLQKEVFLKVQDLAQEFGNGHYVTYINDTSKLYLSRKTII